MNVAGKITKAVGTMWCAIVFGLLALVSLPTALRSGDLVVIVSWISQTFLQLVLLSIIMVGQDQQSKGTEALIRETHDCVLEELAELKQILPVIQELAALHR